VNFPHDYLYFSKGFLPWSTYLLVQFSFRALNFEVESNLINNPLVRDNQENIGRRQKKSIGDVLILVITVGIDMMR